MIDLKCGDCLELIKQIPDKSIDLVIMDPPYLFDSDGGGGAFGSKTQQYHNELKNANITKGFDYELLNDLIRVMKKVNIYIWCNKKQLLDYMSYFKDYNMTLLTWHKTNPVPMCNNKYLSDTEYCLHFREKGVKINGTFNTKFTYYLTPLNQADKKKYGHPTIKPLEIIENLVINSSEENDMVLDCFMGSGTTGVAALKHNRNFIGIEIDKCYFKIAKERIENELDPFAGLTVEGGENVLNELKRPSLDVTLEITIPEIAPIKHDLAKVEKFVTELDTFYRNAIDEAINNFDLNIKDVKTERTKVRKILKTIEDNRKAMVKAYKEPIKDFEETSKRIETILKGTDEMMKALVDEDKATKEDPFGENDIPKTFSIGIECTEKECEDIIKYIEKKGIKVWKQ